MRLFHFSDNPDIAIFHPRPVRIPAARPPGQEWLNGALVWAIDEPHSIMYLFPRECPRIVIWPTSATTDRDRVVWLGKSSGRAVAYIERAWLERFQAATLYRYALSHASFEDIGDAGMWVSRVAVRSIVIDRIDSLETHLSAAGVELRPVGSLTPLKQVWASTLHASGIRLRNARA